MVLWPVINSLVLLLIGYDVDLTRVVQDMRLMLLNRRVSHSEVDDVEYGESIDRDGDHRSLRSARPQTIQGEPKIRVPPRCKLCGSRIDPNGYAASGPPMSNYASSAPCSPHHTPSSFLSDPSGISAILGSEYSSHSLCDSPYDELQRFDFSPTSTLPTPELERISESYDRTAPPMYIPPPFKQYASYSPSPDNNNNRRKSYPPRRRSI